jgi:hypothetical protein
MASVNLLKLIVGETYLFIHIRPINQPLTTIGMNPFAHSHTPNLHPDMIRQIQAISRIETDGTAVGAE